MKIHKATPQTRRDLFGNEVMKPKLIDREVLAHAFVQTMHGITAKQLVRMLYSPFQAVIDFAELCSGKDTGQKISMLFNPHRYSTRTNRTNGGPSIVDSFNNESFLSGLARASIFKHDRVNELLYQVLQLGINGAQYVNEFPPYKAQQIYLGYSAKRILDPCAGWGGRMIGAASIGSHYHGFEPSTQTYKGLLKLGEFLKSFGNGFDFHVECKPFEDSGRLDSYDIAFTSPPYYDTEIYSDEPTNSCNRYSTFDDWCEGFYLPMVKKATRAAKIFILNIGTRQYPLTSVLRKAGFVLEEMKHQLGGRGGLGRTGTGERFYLVTAKDGLTVENDSANARRIGE